MKLAKLSNIFIRPDRQRKEFDLAALAELSESIRERGLMHPIVLRQPRGDEPQDRMVLVAGERRMRAVQDLADLGQSFSCDLGNVEPGMIPYLSLGELDELSAEEAEWEENNARADLTWQEKAAATARLASIRSRQAEARGAPLPTVAAIAEEIRGSAAGGYQEATRRELIVARHLADPEVAKAKTVDEAFKLLKRKEETSKRAQRAVEVGRTYSAASAHRALHGSALDLFPTLSAESFDVILTDPPYGIDADQFGDSGGKAAGAHFYADTYENWKTLSLALAAEGFRVAKPQAHLYCFCDITRFEELKAILAAAGWDCFRTPLIWHKPNGSRTPWVDGGPQRQFELVLYARKGKRPVTRIYSDVLTYRSDENLGHPAQKPVALLVDLLRRSCSAGDSVLDPFAGSGSIFPAAQELKLAATGIELDAAAYGLCTSRIDSLKG